MNLDDGDRLQGVARVVKEDESGQEEGVGDTAAPPVAAE
jgi:hypothetical protein